MITWCNYCKYSKIKHIFKKLCRKHPKRSWINNKINDNGTLTPLEIHYYGTYYSLPEYLTDIISKNKWTDKLQDDYIRETRSLFNPSVKMYSPRHYKNNVEIYPLNEDEFFMKCPNFKPNICIKCEKLIDVSHKHKKCNYEVMKEFIIPIISLIISMIALIVSICK